jgi:hypothetical protein
LEEKGKTIAILPTQINKIYPKENRSLAQQIINEGGLLISEYFSEPLSRNDSINRFIERDRLQAMFAKAIILIASYRKGEGDSGSRHAMKAAKTYGIDRYMMYNTRTDENNKKFGLCKDLNEPYSNENVKILKTNSLKNIYKIGIQKNDFDENYTQQALDAIDNNLYRYIYDLDNTLIYTDLLNNEAYNYALNQFGLSPILDCERVTREIVFLRYPNLDNNQKDEIIKIKQKYFISNLHLTKINANAIKILQSQKTENCYLWTHAEIIRVKAILKHHLLTDAFKEVIYSDKNDVINDINKICHICNCTENALTFYEDNNDILNVLKQLNIKTVSI